MPLNHNIEWEINNSGTFESGAGFNSSNPNAGLNYSYGPNFLLITIDDLTFEYASSFKPGIPSWSLIDSGTFPSGTYTIGIRYIALGGNGEIVGTSELVEYTDFIPQNKNILINSPANPGYPFDHYQVFIRETSGTRTYAQLQNYGGGEVGSAIGVNLTINAFSTLFESILVSNLPYKGNAYLLGSSERNFVTNDIGNFINVENNNIGFRSKSSSLVSNSNFVEIGKNNDYQYAAWFDLASNKTIKKISAVFWAEGSPTGDLFLELRSNNSGVPSNTVIASGGISASSLTNNPQWVDVSINSNLAPGRYWIVMRLDSIPDVSNYVKLGRKVSTGFQNLNTMHLYAYNTSTFTWSNVDTGIAVAIGVSWNSEDIWGEGDYSSFKINKGSLRFEILNVNAGKALICSDFYVANVGSINGIGYLGGRSNNLLSINEHATEFNITSLAHIKSNTYMIAEPIVLSCLSLSGYQNSHFDLGNKPKFIVDSSVSPSLYDYDTGVGAINIVGDKIQILNIEIDGSDFAEKLLTSTLNSVFICNCWFHNSAHTALYFGSGNNKAVWIESTRIGDITNSSAISAGIYANFANHLTVKNCYFHNIAGTGVFANDLSVKIEYTIFHNIYGPFTNNGHALIADECTDVTLSFLTVNQCSKSGVNLRKFGSAIICNSLFTNGGDHGILIDMDNPLSFSLNRIFNNAFYNNDGNQFEVNPPLLTQNSPITLNESPYVHLGNDYVDFTLNSATGSAEYLIGKAFPTSFPGTNSIQKLDIGAVQSFGNQPTPRRNPVISLF